MTAEEQMREIALDWLKNSDDDNTKALRGYVLQMLSGANLQVEELKASLACIVGECATLDEAVMVANRALGKEGVR